MRLPSIFYCYYYVSFAGCPDDEVLEWEHLLSVDLTGLRFRAGLMHLHFLPDPDRRRFKIWWLRGRGYESTIRLWLAVAGDESLERDRRFGNVWRPKQGEQN